MAEKVAELQVKFAGAQTQRELEKLARTVREIRKDELIGSKNYLQAAKLEADVKNKLHSLNVQAYSDNAKMKDSYFKLGTEIRRNKLAAVELSQAMGFDRSSLGGILTAFTAGGLLSGFIVAGAGVIKMLRDQKKEAIELNDAYDKMLGIMSLNERLSKFSGLKVAAGRARSGYEDTRIKTLPLDQQLEAYRSQLSSAEGMRGNTPVDRMTFQGREAYYTNEKRILDLKQQIYDVEKKITGEASKQTGLYLDAALARQKVRGAREKIRVDEHLRGHYRGSAGYGSGSEGLMGGEPGYGGRQIVESLPNLAPKVDHTMEAIKDGAIEAGQAIRQHITGALLEAMGVGNDLAGQLFSILLNLGLGFLTSGIGATGGGGGASVVEIIGRPGRGPTRQYGGGIGASSLSFGEIRIRHDHLAISVKKGNQSLGRSRID